METPFIYGKIAEGENFIDREYEKKLLERNILGHINTILISPRRWGKSSLVYAVANNLAKDKAQIRFCFIDMFSVRTEADFLSVFASELIKATSNKWEEWADNAKHFITGLIPRFSFGANPMNDFQISFDWKEAKSAPLEILNLPEKISTEKGLQVVVCIDEFQNLAFFEDPLAFQKILRSVWQRHQTATYCLFGSKRHMLVNIFEKPSMPFYKFGDTIFLQKISDKYWVDYIRSRFEMTGKAITVPQSEKIALLMENHPYYVQLYARAIWNRTHELCFDQILDDALVDIILQNEIFFQRETDNLSNTQFAFLKALTSGISQFSSKDVLQTYNLGSQGNIRKIKTALEKKEIIDLWGKNIEFLDPVFKLWFKKNVSQQSDKQVL
jgi:uncharacterized protein